MVARGQQMVTKDKQWWIFKVLRPSTMALCVPSMCLPHILCAPLHVPLSRTLHTSSTHPSICLSAEPSAHPPCTLHTPFMPLSAPSVTSPCTLCMPSMYPPHTLCEPLTHLSMCLSAAPTAHPSIHMCLSAEHSTHPSMCLSTKPSAHPSMCLPTEPFAHPLCTLCAPSTCPLCALYVPAVHPFWCFWLPRCPHHIQSHYWDSRA